MCPAKTGSRWAERRKPSLPLAGRMGRRVGWGLFRGRRRSTISTPPVRWRGHPPRRGEGGALIPAKAGSEWAERRKPSLPLAGRVARRVGWGLFRGRRCSTISTPPVRWRGHPPRRGEGGAVCPAKAGSEWAERREPSLPLAGRVGQAKPGSGGGRLFRRRRWPRCSALSRTERSGDPGPRAGAWKGSFRRDRSIPALPSLGRDRALAAQEQACGCVGTAFIPAKPDRAQSPRP